MTSMIVFAAAVATFNLTCSGMMRTVASDQPAEPYTRVYRIDLVQGIYCTDECKDTHRISEISQTRLLMRDERKLNGNLLVENQDVINRETGKHYNWSKLISTQVYEGQCEPSAFTGFPKIETKF